MLLAVLICAAVSVTLNGVHAQGQKIDLIAWQNVFIVVFLFVFPTLSYGFSGFSLMIYISVKRGKIDFLTPFSPNIMTVALTL
jgi:hypothetical protein